MSIKTAKNVIISEIDALRNLLDSIDENLEKAIELIRQSIVSNRSGHIIVTGVGKSGHIGRKIAATLASTGTPSFFMHATEAIHGDLGAISKNDIVLAISHSGQTIETLNMISAVRELGVKLIAMTSDRNSELAKTADITLYIGAHNGSISPLEMVPTGSAVATLALGDALAIALATERNFTRRDFGKLHPGGTLGEKLRQEL